MKRKMMSFILCAAMVGSMNTAGTVLVSADAEKVITVGYPSSLVPDAFNQVCDAAEEKLGVTIEAQPYADESGETIFRSLLASGEAPDVILYNSGALLSKLNPSQYFADLSSYTELVDKLDKDFKESVTVDGAIYGIPQSSSQVGGVLYNKEMYEELGLEIPKTWDEFLANCDALKDAGKTAVIGSFGSTWTSQLVFLADYFNVVAEEPDFSAKFEAGEAKYATTPAALRSFEKYEDLIPYYNEDCAVATYDDACTMLAEGDGAHYFMQSQALSNIYSLYDKETVDNIGFFPVPGDHADSNGMTVWPANAIYVNKDAKAEMEDIISFMEYYISDEGMDIYAETQPPVGPFNIVGYKLKGDPFAAVEQMQEYFDNGDTALAQEYETSVKGAGCESICVEVSNGQITGQEAAEKYDLDCYKMAVQLGLDWEE
ncbi:MAG: extracellular solute-binding protein [Eubacteriales bacterium]|nr:extracellular solute-binding protein [Eubacteriales bacterium]